MTRKDFNDLIRRDDLWTVVLIVCVLIAAICLCFILTGCGSTGGAYVYGVSDAYSGYDPGLGVRVDLATPGAIAAVGKIEASNAAKHDAQSGYTYSALAGMRFGSRWYVEPGWIVYGYESQFADGMTWRKQRNSWCAAIGYRGPDWSLAARYVPSPGDNYNSDELSLESRFALGKMAFYFEPSAFRITSPYDGTTATHSAIKAGVGVRW